MDVSDSELITAAQSATGTTQAQLAAAIGYRLRALTYWLAGRPAPEPARKLLALLAAGKITKEDLAAEGAEARRSGETVQDV